MTERALGYPCPVRIAVISDTHMPRGPRRLPERCLEELAAADLTLHLGDVIEADLLDALEALGPLAAVHGNVDSAEVRRRLPEEREIDVEGVRLALVHDAGPARGRLARLRRRFPQAHAALFGHSHLPLHETDGAFQIFNPGSPTERRRAPRRTMGLAEIEHGHVTFTHVELEPPAAAASG